MCPIQKIFLDYYPNSQWQQNATRVAGRVNNDLRWRCHKPISEKNTSYTNPIFFGRGFQEGSLHLFGQSLALVRRHPPLHVEVSLVAHQHHGNAEERAKRSQVIKSLN